MAKSNSKKDYTTFYFVLLLVLVVIVWVLFSYLLDNYRCSISDKNTLGDTFTGISALFSGLAFAGIIYTIIVQRKEMREQTIEQKKFQRLSALSTLLNAYTEAGEYWYTEIKEGIQKEKSEEAFNYYSKKKRECIEEIEGIVKETEYLNEDSGK